MTRTTPTDPNKALPADNFRLAKRRPALSRFISRNPARLAERAVRLGSVTMGAAAMAAAYFMAKMGMGYEARFAGGFGLVGFLSAGLPRRFVDATPVVERKNGVMLVTEKGIGPLDERGSEKLQKLRMAGTRYPVSKSEDGYVRVDPRFLDVNKVYLSLVPTEIQGDMPNHLTWIGDDKLRVLGSVGHFAKVKIAKPGETRARKDGHVTIVEDSDALLIEVKGDVFPGALVTSNGQCNVHGDNEGKIRNGLFFGGLCPKHGGAMNFFYNKLNKGKYTQQVAKP